MSTDHHDQHPFRRYIYKRELLSNRLNYYRHLQPIALLMQWLTISLYIIYGWSDSPTFKEKSLARCSQV